MSFFLERLLSIFKKKGLWMGALILCNLLWSFNPLFGKQILLLSSPIESSLLKIFFAWIGFGILMWCLPTSSKTFSIKKLFSSPKRIFSFFCLSFFGLTLSNIFNFLGLLHTTASETAILYALEPLLATLLATWILRESFGINKKLSLFFAIIGFLLLSNAFSLFHGKSFQSNPYGNLLIILALLGEGSFSVASRNLAPKFHAIPLFFAALSAALCFLCLFFILQDPTHIFYRTKHMLFLLKRKEMIFYFFYIGSLGVGLGYFLWLWVLKKLDVSLIVPTLFIQVALGTLWGRLFLKETLSLFQIGGAFFILLSLFFIIKESTKTHSSLSKEKTISSATVFPS